MINIISINLKTDIKTDRPTSLPITLMSQDKNNNQFILRFTSGGESITLDDTYTVEVLTKFTKSGASRLTSAVVHQGYATWEFDTAYIAQDETVYNYVYVRKSGSLVVSADSNAFYFAVGLSEVDKDAGRVAETYDENYEKYLDEFKDVADFTAIQQAEAGRESSETTRKTNETTRVSNENARKSAEVIRLANETGRVNAEIVRSDFYEGFDGRLDDLESGRVILKNLVANGDFRNGFDGWTVTGDVQNIGGRAKLVRLTGNPTASLSYRDRTIFSNRNDVYYMSVRGELVNRVSGSDGVMVNDTVNVQPVWTLPFQPRGVVSNSSRIFNLSPNNTPYLYANTVAGSEYFIDHIIIVNLTEEFGVGKEPTKEWMDFLISQSGYFEEYFLGDAWQVQELMRMNNVKANKQQQAWITPTLLNGFTGDVKYRKTDFGQLEMRGYLEYPSALNTISVPCFAFVEGYTPTWIRSSGYSDQRLKMTLEIDMSLITGGTARSSISGFNNSFYITDGGGGTRWHINALIPMD